MFLRIQSQRHMLNQHNTVHNSVFYCVANMPGAVPVASTYALTNATLPFALSLANLGWEAACDKDKNLAKGLNVCMTERFITPPSQKHMVTQALSADLAASSFLNHLQIERVGCKFNRRLST
jgi:alanine dehydrogenase